ncbi:MAG: hypothetical protein JWO58_574, partial [Chitinophagaceae bacterium]|nr:hypothetical protein [Chitinophagaceae bacterium]
MGSLLIQEVNEKDQLQGNLDAS